MGYGHGLVSISLGFLQVLRLVLELLFTADGQLDTAYCSRDPGLERQQNVLSLLQRHLSHTANAHLLPGLLAAAAARGCHATRLLRVLCAPLFPSALYKLGPLLARGAYARVRS